MTHKAILQAIQTQLPTRTTGLTRTSSIILDVKLFGCRTIGKVPASPLLENPVLLLPQIIMIPAVKKIFADATSGNLWTNRTPQKLSRMGVNGTTPGIIGHACGISETSSLDLIGIIGATASPYGLNKIQKIWNIWKSIFLDLRHSNKLDTSIHRQFANNLVVPPIFSELIGDKLPDGSIRDIYTRCRMKVAADPVNILAPQFVD